MTGSLLTQSLVGWLRISVVTLASGTSCTGYMPLSVLKLNLVISSICIGGRCLCTPVFGCLNQLPDLVDGSQLNGRGHTVMPFPSCCVSAPCGTEFLLVCPVLCLGVDIWISRVCGLRRGPLFSEYGTDSI